MKTTSMLNQSRSKNDPPRNIGKEYRLEMIDKVFEHWELHPEMRLMQLLVSACPQDDLFYVTDEKLIENINELTSSDEDTKGN